MLIKLFARRRKTVAAAMSAMLFATAYQGGGCTLQVDENLVQSIIGAFSETGGSGEFEFGPVGGHFEGPEGPGECDGWYEPEDGVEDDHE